MDFHENRVLNIFRKSVEKIKFLLKSDKNSDSLNEDQYVFYSTSRSVILRIRNA